MNALALKLIAGLGAFLLLVILVQDRNRWKATATSLTIQLNDLAAKSKVRQKETAKIITRYRDAKPIIEERVRVVERAPLPGLCKTPQAVLEADL